MFTTHEVLNQPPHLPELDVFGADRALGEAVAREGAGWALDDLHELGRLAGTSEARDLGWLANRHPPVLETYDRYGHRIDRVEYHPAYHELMAVAVGNGLAAAPWVDARPGAHVGRAAGFVVWSQVDQGHGCPISMTYSVVPALRHSDEVTVAWEPLLSSTRYDPRPVPWQEKAGLTCGMAMTEKQGGSDVRANTSTARLAQDGTWRLTGHKWFCSAPMSDGFLVLAQADAGLSCFLVPRFEPDGTRGGWRVQRLKDKLGDRSNASSEVEFADVFAWPVGEPGRGVATIIEMVNHTRLDCTLGSVATMRAALTQAIHHTRHRSAFGRLLSEQPLMRQVLADLAVEVEAATHSVMRLARCHDPGLADEHDVALRRLATPVLKYMVCKRTPVVVAEALECLGGSGYVEESGMPRLFRQSPLNGIWEGSGNVICLDVLRAIRRNPDSLAAFFDEVGLAAGADSRLDTAAADVERRLRDESSGSTAEMSARRTVERMSLVLQGSLLVRHAPPAVADAFCASRLDGDAGLTPGTLAPGCDTAAIVERSAHTD